jgi:protein-export chaperone SecB
MAETPANGNGAETAPQPPLTINFHYLKDLSFENPNAPMSLVGNKPQPAVDLSVNTGVKQLDPTNFEVVLTVSATAKFGEETGFVVECTYGGVFTIGEIGYVDTDGYVYITDRFSDMIVAGGVNIYPAEAEAVIIAHPKVADVAVIGVPDADLGEAVKALVVPLDPADPPSPDELIGLCRQHLAGYKCPRTVDIVSTVGRNAMGKVNKRALRAPYWEGGRTIG